MKWIGRGAVTPITHNEHYFASGVVFLQKYEEINKCGMGEWKYATAKDIRFNDQFVTFIHKKSGETIYWEVKNWLLRIYPSDQEAPKKGDQLSIFDLRGGGI